MISTLFIVLYFVVFLLVVAPLLILHSVLSGSPDFIYAGAVKGLSLGLRLARIRVRVEGAEHVPGRVCIFVANHASNLDPLVTVVAIPRRVAILAKKEVFRIPILATAMRLVEILPVDRSDPDAASAAVDRAVEYLKSGVSYLVFPEGTRSPDGRLRPFKKGTFVMAIRSGAAVVPVSVIGTHRLMGKGEWRIRAGDVLVRFGEPIDASSYTLEQRGELLERAHAAVAARLPEDQRPLPASRL